MGLLDVFSRVTTVYKADTSDHIKELQKLKGEEKAAAKQQLEDAKATNDALEKQIKTIGKVALAVGTTVAVAKGAWDAYQHVVERSRLETAAMGVDIGRLQQASGGLKTRMDLLRDAAMLQQGAFKLSGSQMAMVERAMLGLTRAGFDQAEVTKKVTDAIVKLEGDGLKDFGIRVREATGDGDKFAAVMEAIEAKSKGVSTATADSTESVATLGVKFRDSMDQIETSIGRIVIALGPLIAKVAGLVDAAAGAADGEDNWLTRISGAYNPVAGIAQSMARGAAAQSYFSFEDQDPALLTELQKSDPVLAGFLGGYRAGRTSEAEGRQAEIQTQVADLIAEQQRLFKNVGRAGARRGGGGARRGVTRAEAFRGIQVVDASGNVNGQGPGAAGYQGFGGGNDSAIDSFDIRQGLTEIGNQREGDANAEMERLRSGVAEFQRLAAEAANTKRQSMLESVFGKVGDFDLYAKGFEMLTGAVGSAYDAWISGSASGSQAVKKFIGESLAASGKQMAVEAIKEGAWALASLAIGDVGGAARHGIAAAAFGAGAVTAGIAAKELGAGSTTAPAAGARAAAPTLPAGGGGIQRTERTIVIGHSFAEDTPRMRVLKAERLWNDAKGSGGTVYS